MRFGVLGPLVVRNRQGAAVKIPELKVRALLVDLLVHAGHPVAVDHLVSDIWGTELPVNPVGALQTKISQLRRVLDGAEAGGRALLTSRVPGYQLDVDGHYLDTEEFRALTSQALAETEPRPRAQLLYDALALWRGVAFADFADQPFVVAAARRLEEERLNAVEALAETRLQLGDHSLLVVELGDLVAQHPLRERLRAAQMLALHRAGRRAEALAAYGDLRKQLAEEIGLDPSPELVSLHQSILEQDPELDAPSPPPTSVARSVSNLPTPLTELIGRADAVSEVGKALSSARLVTLVGPGGVGKTRLGLEVATLLRPQYPANAWLVELGGQQASVSGVTDLAEAVTVALGIRDDVVNTEHTPLVDRLADALADKQMLLVLDNCEHVIEHAVDLVGGLLRAAPGLRVLATSREPLSLPGEVVWTVPPLELPAPECTTDPTELAGSSAVRLFVARASAAAQDFRLTEDNAADVAMLCARLDGIPLALELAATRVRGLGLRGLVSRLDDRFRLLANGSRGVPARQQTLRAVIDWSWELLTEPERTVLRRIAVHVDGCTAAAAEAVCAGGSVARADVVDLLARLVDRSLLVVTEQENGPRYRLLESVAEYCVDKLAESDEAAEIRARHRAHHLAFAERAAAQLRGHGQRQWLALIDNELSNLCRAIDDAAKTGAADDGLRLVNALAWYWFLRGRLSDAIRTFDVALEIPGGTPTVRSVAEVWRAGLAMLVGGDGASLRAAARAALAGFTGDDRERAWAEWLLGFTQWGIGELSAGATLIDAALAGARRCGDEWVIAAALAARARLAMGRGELKAQARDGMEAWELFRDLGDRWGQLRATDMLCAHAQITGDYPQAQRLNRETLRAAEELGLWSEVAHKLAVSGRISLLGKDFAAAAEFHRRAVRLSVEQSDPLTEQFAEMGIALEARRQGRFAEAQECLLRWLKWNRRLGGDAGVALILAELGFIAEQRGDVSGARSLHREGLTAAESTGDPRAVALALEGLAGALSLGGENVDAARLLGAAAHTRESVGAPLPLAEGDDLRRAEARASAALGDEYATWFADGAAFGPPAV